MRNVANDSSQDLRQLFTEVAVERKLTPGIIEKDFWVCWVLDYLFSLSEFKDVFEFKGGTSLSKAFGVIERFSEDIDLILDWEVLGLSNEELWAERSNTKQSQFVEQVNQDTVEYLSSTLKPNMEQDFSKLLNKEYSLTVLEQDQTIAFAYPRIFEERAVLQEIRLEIGVLGAWSPATTRDISPYVAESYPHLFSTPMTGVRTVDAIRTFWEKATILHKEAFRESGKVPARYSRHYYDMYQLSKSPVLKRALDRTDLLRQVVEFKSKFYYARNAHYELAECGSLRLMPPETSLSALREDYAAMRNMIFGEYPSFDDILAGLSKIEYLINS